MKQLFILISLVLFFSSSWSHAWTRTQTFEPDHVPCPGCKTKDGAIGSRAQFGSSGTTYTKDYVHSGKQSSKNYIASGSTGKDWGGAMGYSADLKEGGELWFRKYVYFPKDYSFSASPVAKFIRFSSGKQWLSLVWNPDGSIRASNPISGAQGKGIFKLEKGVWQAVEMYVKFSSGKGIFRVWKDGKLVFEDKASSTLKGGNKSNRMIWGTYWNGGAPKSQSHYVDDIVLTSSRPSNKDSKGNAFIGLGKGNVASSQPPEPEENSPPQPPKITSN